MCTLISSCFCSSQILSSVEENVETLRTREVSSSLKSLEDPASAFVKPSCAVESTTHHHLGLAVRLLSASPDPFETPLKLQGRNARPGRSLPHVPPAIVVPQWRMEPEQLKDPSPQRRLAIPGPPEVRMHLLGPKRLSSRGPSFSCITAWEERSQVFLCARRWCSRDDVISERLILAGSAGTTIRTTGRKTVQESSRELSSVTPATCNSSVPRALRVHLRKRQREAIVPGSRDLLSRLEVLLFR